MLIHPTLLTEEDSINQSINAIILKIDERLIFSDLHES